MPLLSQTTVLFKKVTHYLAGLLVTTAYRHGCRPVVAPLKVDYYCMMRRLIIQFA